MSELEVKFEVSDRLRQGSLFRDVFFSNAIIFSNSDCTFYFVVVDVIKSYVKVLYQNI